MNAPLSLTPSANAPTAPTVAENHARCDGFIAAVFAQPQNKKHCCVKGCSACCSEVLYASEAEADYIIEAMTPEQKAETIDRLNSWIEKVRPTLSARKPDAVAYRQLDAPCPLLKNGLCSVYERRPFGCRSFFALGKPSGCDLPQRAHQKFVIFPDDIFRFMGIPAMVNSKLSLDHLGVLLAERLLGLKLFSASRKAMFVSQVKTEKFI